MAYSIRIQQLKTSKFPLLPTRLDKLELKPHLSLSLLAGQLILYWLTGWLLMNWFQMECSLGKAV